MLALPQLSASELATGLVRLGFVPREDVRGRTVLARGASSVVVPRAGTLGPALVASLVRTAGVDPVDFRGVLDPCPSSRDAPRGGSTLHIRTLAQ